MIIEQLHADTTTKFPQFFHNLSVSEKRFASKVDTLHSKVVLFVAFILYGGMKFRSCCRYFSLIRTVSNGVSGSKNGQGLGANGGSNNVPDSRLPKKPKRPCNSFMRFVNVVRAELLRQYPDSSNKGKRITCLLL